MHLLRTSHAYTSSLTMISYLGKANGYVGRADRRNINAGENIAQMSKTQRSGQGKLVIHLCDERRVGTSSIYVSNDVNNTNYSIGVFEYDVQLFDCF